MTSDPSQVNAVISFAVLSTDSLMLSVSAVHPVPACTSPGLPVFRLYQHRSYGVEGLLVMTPCDSETHDIAVAVNTLKLKLKAGTLSS